MNTRIVITEHSNGPHLAKYDPTLKFTSKDVGKEGEIKTLNLFSNVVGAQNVFIDPRDKELELCDGIIRYGDTLFFIQLKTRNEVASETSLDRWVEKQTKKVSSQRKSTISQLNNNDKDYLIVEDLRGKANKLKWKRYNIVFLLILAVEDAAEVKTLQEYRRKRTNDKEQEEEYPLIRILLNDIFMIDSALPDAFKFLIMEYLRAIQYQTVHYLGKDWDHFLSKFPIADIRFYLPLFSQNLMQNFKDGRISKTASKKIIGHIDHIANEDRHAIDYHLNNGTVAPTYIIKVRPNDPFIYVFRRMIASKPEHSLEECLRLSSNVISETLINDPRYKEIKYTEDTPVILFGCFEPYNRSESKIFTMIFDPIGYLDQPYDLEKDLPSRDFILAHKS